MKKIDGNGVNAHGLSNAEIQQALDSAAEFKNCGVEHWQEARKKLILELLTVDDELALTFLKNIKEHRPELLKEV